MKRIRAENFHEICRHLKSVIKLFEDPHSHANYHKMGELKIVRKNIPYIPDPLLEENMKLEAEIIQESRQTQQIMRKNLKNMGFSSKDYTVDNETVVIFKDDCNKTRFFTDFSSEKIEKLVLPHLANQNLDHTSLKAYSTNIKTCLSIGNNQSATFCGSNDGVLLYLGAKSRDALVLASPHDISSPSETHDQHPQFLLARNGISAYCVDQKKFQITYDLIKQLKDVLIQEINKKVSEIENKPTSRYSPNDLDVNVLSKSLDALKKEFPNTFNKKFYCKEKKLHCQQAFLKLVFLQFSIFEYPQRKSGPMPAVNQTGVTLW